MLVLKDESGDIIGCAKAEFLLEQGIKVINIGPLAVHPLAQVTVAYKQSLFVSAVFFQGKGIGSKMLTYLESQADISRIEVVSCRSDLFPFYTKRGYIEVSRFPCEQYVPPEVITRPGLKMVVMEKHTISFF